MGSGCLPNTRRSPPALTTPQSAPAQRSASTARSTAYPFAMPSSVRCTRCFTWTAVSSISSCSQRNNPSVSAWTSFARCSTAMVQGSMAMTLPAGAALILATSLSASWRLISRCTRSSASKPPSMAPEASRGRRISTSVPSSGRARLTLLEGRLIEAKQALDAIGYVAARKRGAADVTDILVQLQRIARSLPGKLAPPRSVADLVAVAFEVLQDLDASHAAIGPEPDGIGDQLMLAEHRVDDEPAPLGDPPQLPMRRIGQSERFLGETGAGKDGLLRLFDAQIHGRIGGRGNYGDWRSNESRPEHHQKLKPSLMRSSLRSWCSP